MNELIKYLNERIEEAKTSIDFFKKKVNEDMRRLGKHRYKNESVNYTQYYTMLGELAVLMQIKSKFQNCKDDYINTFGLEDDIYKNHLHT